LIISPNLIGWKYGEENNRVKCNLKINIFILLSSSHKNR